MSALTRIKRRSTGAISRANTGFENQNEAIASVEVRLNMLHPARCLQIFLSLLAQGALLMSNNPIVAYGRQPGSPISPSADTPGDLNDILEYISAGWDTLTRTMNRCESLEDSKTDGEPALYLPAEM